MIRPEDCTVFIFGTQNRSVAAFKTLPFARKVILMTDMYDEIFRTLTEADLLGRSAGIFDRAENFASVYYTHCPEVTDVVASFSLGRYEFVDEPDCELLSFFCSLMFIRTFASSLASRTGKLGRTLRLHLCGVETDMPPHYDNVRANFFRARVLGTACTHLKSPSLEVRYVRYDPCVTNPHDFRSLAYNFVQRNVLEVPDRGY